MGAGETEIEMAQRHVRKGKRIIARQRDLIEQRWAYGISTRYSEILLATFEDMQRLHEDHLARIQSRKR